MSTPNVSSEGFSPGDIKVRQVTHYQWSWTGTQAGQPGVWTVQLILDQGAAEQVLTLTQDDADNIQDLFETGEKVYYDIDRQVLMFGTKAV